MIKSGSQLEDLLKQMKISFVPADIADAKRANKKLAMLPDDCQFKYTLDADYHPMKEGKEGKTNEHEKQDRKRIKR